MEYYNTTPQPARHPTQPAYHHSASANAPHYQNSAYALPATHNQPAQTMPTYYVSGGSPSSHHLSRSYSHNTHQPVVYTTSSGSRQYLSPRDYAYADTGRRRRSSSVGQGGHYHNTGHSSSSHRRSSSRTPVYYTGSSPSHRRSHSTSRHHGSSSHNYSTGRHSSSAHRPSGVYVSSMPLYHSLPSTDGYSHRVTPEITTRTIADTLTPLETGSVAGLA